MAGRRASGAWPFVHGIANINPSDQPFHSFTTARRIWSGCAGRPTGQASRCFASIFEGQAVQAGVLRKRGTGTQAFIGRGGKSIATCVVYDRSVSLKSNHTMKTGVVKIDLLGVNLSEHVSASMLNLTDAWHVAQYRGFYDAGTRNLRHVKRRLERCRNSVARNRGPRSRRYGELTATAAPPRVSVECTDGPRAALELSATGTIIVSRANISRS